jgi:tripartite-type tricarboxylate transporter receptor subunit TctC
MEHYIICWNVEGTMSLVVSIARAMVALLLGASVACAEDYPVRPVRIIVAFAAGGGTDLLGRTVAQKLNDALGQSFIVENRGGVGGNFGTEMAAKAPADGYTLLFGYSSNFSISPFLYKDPGYDALKDFEPISLVTIATNIMAASPSLPVSNLKELQAYAKAHPNVLNYGSAGTGTLGHLTVELFKSVAGVEMTHVPYKGNSDALTDILAGRIQLFAGSPAAVIPYIDDGRLKALGITNRERLPDMKNIPTFIEQGFNVEAQAWFGLLAPKGTPSAIIKKLNTAVVDGMKSPEVKASFARLGYDVATDTPEEFAAFIKADYDKWKVVVTKTGLERQ